MPWTSNLQVVIKTQYVVHMEYLSVFLAPTLHQYYNKTNELHLFSHLFDC